MDDGDAAEAAFDEKWNKLKIAEEELRHYPMRKVGPGENDWPRSWISDVSQTIAEIIKLGRNKNDDRETLEFLVNHPLIDFQNKENPSLPLVDWTAEDWFSFLDIKPHLVLKMFEKCADALPFDYHKTLVTAILENVAKKRLTYINRFAPDVIRISFPKCEELFDNRLKLSAFRACRMETFGAHMNARDVDKYMNLWGILIKYFPRDSVNWSAELLVGYDQQNPEDWNTLFPYMSPGRYILTVSLKLKNVFKMRQLQGMDKYKIAMLKLWESFDFDNLETLFYSQYPDSLLDELFATIKMYAFERNKDVIDSLSSLLLKLCDYFCVQNWPKLMYHLEDLRDTLLSDGRGSYQVLRLALQISYKLSCENYVYIHPIPRRELDFFRFEHFPNSRECQFNDAVMFVKTYYPSPHFESLWRTQEVLGYGSESFGLVWDQDLSIEQIKLLAEVYKFELELEGGKLFQTNYDDYDFGGNKFTHETFPGYLNLISSLVMAQMGAHLEELELPKDQRKYLNPSSGLQVFYYAVNIGLTLILDTFMGNINLWNSCYEIENSPMDIFNGQLFFYRKTKMTMTEIRSYSRGMSDEVRAFLSNRNDNLNKYFVPLVEMATLSLEVLDFEEAYELYFEDFYVPAVKALLVSHPPLALQLIVAFCRTELRLNLSATFPKTDIFKADWQRVKDLKTSEVAKQHFESVSVPLSEVYAKNAQPVPCFLEPIMMDRYVSATINHFQLYEMKAAADYLVIKHYYDLLEKKRIDKEELKDMDDKAVHDILLPQEEND